MKPIFSVADRAVDLDKARQRMSVHLTSLGEIEVPFLGSIN